MKYGVKLFVGMMVVLSLFIAGCRDDDSSPPTSVTLSSGTGRIEGQLVADAGTQFTKLVPDVLQNGTDVSSSTVYPVSGANVELVQNGTVVATTTTDEYGRFYFTNLPPGDYEVRPVSSDGSEAHYHIAVNADQTVAVFGRVVPEGSCYWDQQYGSQWDDMPYGYHWGYGFCGGSPGTGYWYDGQGWRGPGMGSGMGAGARW